MFFCAIVLGSTAGAVVGAVGGQLYLIIVSPAVAALAAAVATAKALRMLRAADARIALVAGILVALSSTAAMLGVTYQTQRAAMVAEWSSVQGYSDKRLEVALQAWEKKHGGSNTIAFLKMRLDGGARLTEGTILDLSPAGNGILLLVEFLVSGGLALRLLRKSQSEPFCSPCDAWYARRVVGTAALGSQTQLRSALQNKQLYKVGRRLDDSSLNRPVKLHGRFCDTCTVGDAYLELEVQELGKKATVVFKMTVSHNELDSILDAKSGV